MEEQEIKKTTPSKCEFLGAVISMGVIGFWIGIGVTLAVKTVNNLEYCIDELIRRKSLVTANKMAEENQVQQVTTKNPKKVEAGKKMAEHNRRGREELKTLKIENNILALGHSSCGGDRCS